MDENLQLDALPLADADQLARQRIEHHREQMSAWRKARAHRLATEREHGKTVEQIATAIGVTPATVYEVLRAAR